jgi:FK506-binding protein 1
MGVKIETVIKGDGKTFPRVGDRITVHYEGTLQDGTVFDSTRKRGEPFTTVIGVGKVIRGWDEAMPRLSLGEKAILTVSSDDAYGPRGVPPLIPPNSDLRFDLELISVF